MQIAPSTYYAAKARPTLGRLISDRSALVEIDEVDAENVRVYGARKLHAAINRRGTQRADPAKWRLASPDAPSNS